MKKIYIINIVETNNIINILYHNITSKYNFNMDRLKTCIPSLLEIQLTSFCWFLEYGILEVLDEIFRISPYRSFKSLELNLSRKFYGLIRPRYSITIAKDLRLTYCIGICAHAQFINHKKRELENIQIFLCSIPLMTDYGSFIFRGVERVIISQILRSPGIYYSFTIEKIEPAMINIIPARGSWIKLVRSKHGVVNLYLDQSCKISAYFLTRLLGYTDREIIYGCDSTDFLRETIEEAYTTRSRKFSMHECYRIVARDVLQVKKRRTIKKKIIQVNQFLYSQLFDSSRYDLTVLGRRRLNEKINQITDGIAHTLEKDDFIPLINKLIRFYKKGKSSDDDTIDNLGNKIVRSAGELLQAQLKISLMRVERSIKLSERKKKNVRQNLNLTEKTRHLHELCCRIIEAGFREFFSLNPLSQFLDQINALGEVSHKRKISVFGPEGLSGEHLGVPFRDIYTGQFGRICPLDTSEGLNAGLVNILASFARVNSYGLLVFPFYNVRCGEILSKTPPIYLESSESDNIYIAHRDIYICDNFLISRFIPVRYRGETIRIRLNQATLIELSITQVLSIGASLIPFLEHNDGNRLLMGSHMQRQTVPLLYPDRLVFATGREFQVAADSTRILRSLGYGRVTNVNSMQVYVVDRKNNILKYLLQKYQRSNQSTCVTQRPLASVNEKIIPGQFLASDLSTISGEFSMGKIVYAGYMSFVGYNFEDGIIINERLVIEQVYTSLHLDRMEIQVSRTKLGMERITRDLPLYDGTLLGELDLNGIIKLGTKIHEGDVLVGKVSPINKKKYYSPAQRLLLAVFGEKPKNIRSTPLTTSRNVTGIVIGVRIFLHGKKNPLRSKDYFKVSVYSAESRKIQVGDKLAGKHGNKGIVTRIVESQDMPFLVDGSPIDLILNPLGVPSRMNIGQLFEGMLIIGVEIMGINLFLEPFEDKYSESIVKLLIHKNLKVASRTRKWVYSESYPGKVMLRDGLSGMAYDNPITLTGARFLKLIHLVEDKIHARSTGPYSLIMQQPLQGRSNHGGQRVGEMEVWALEAWGAAYTLYELLTLKSDDIKGRKKIARTIINNQKLPRPSVPESVKLLTKELNALCINVSTYSFKE